MVKRKQLEERLYLISKGNLIVIPNWLLLYPFLPFSPSTFSFSLSLFFFFLKLNYLNIFSLQTFFSLIFPFSPQQQIPFFIATTHSFSLPSHSLLSFSPFILPCCNGAPLRVVQIEESISIILYNFSFKVELYWFQYST